MIIPNLFSKPNITLTSKQGNDITRKWKINILYEHRCKNLHQDISKWLTNTRKDAWQCLLLEKWKSKLQWDITSYQSEWPSPKSLQTVNAGEGVKKREHCFTVGGNVNWYSHYGRWYRFLKKARNKTTIWPSNPTPRHIPWANQNWKRHMYLIVHWSTIYNS